MTGIKQNRCKDCHWYWEDHIEPIERVGGGTYICPCANIGADGWKYWCDNSKEPEHCSEWVKIGEYKPNGIWSDIAKVIRKVAEIVEGDCADADND